MNCYDAVSLFPENSGKASSDFIVNGVHIEISSPIVKDTLDTGESNGCVSLKEFKSKSLHF